MSYGQFIDGKRRDHNEVGFATDWLPTMFAHQRALTTWAIRKGRAAIFAATGLGKTRMEIAWAHAVACHTGMPVLILAPLAVTAQIAGEADAIGLAARSVFDGDDVGDGVNVTNYDLLHRFESVRFGGVALDESSIIKHHNAKAFRALTERFAMTHYRLCATATPAPNDWVELGTHAEFLGVCTRAEMLSEFFTHDGGETQTWRLKRHGQRDFWQWVASWGAMIRMPSDLGFSDAGYILRPVHMHDHVVESVASHDGLLFPTEAQTLSERRDARRASIRDRVAECASIVNRSVDPWVIWCELNAEADALTAAIPGAEEVRGSDDRETKVARLHRFATGDLRVLVTKPSIAGFGLNWQHCAHMAFVGVTDSFESMYQAIRRCWRFGQARDVHVHVFSSTLEGAVVANIKRKQADADAMAVNLAEHVSSAVRCEILGATRTENDYHANQRMTSPAFL